MSERVMQVCLSSTCRRFNHLTITTMYTENTTRGILKNTINWECYIVVGTTLVILVPVTKDHYNSRTSV